MISICPACIAAKSTGPWSKSQAKTAASRANGRLGGRPKRPPHDAQLHAAHNDTTYRKTLEGCAHCEKRKEAAKP